MKKALALALSAALTTGSAFAFNCAPNPCPVPCPPQEKWIEVCETLQVEVPVTEYVDEPCEVKVTRMVPVEEEVEVCESRWITETKTVPYMKKVYEYEEYVVEVPRTERRPETRTRQVTKTICEDVPKTITETVYDEICDPVTGKMCKVPRTVTRTVMVPKKRKICVDEEYTVMVKCKVMVPVTKRRKVCREVPATKEVCERRLVKETVTKKVTVMRPVEETQTVMRKRAVCTTKTVEKQVVKRVKVPVE